MIRQVRLVTGLAMLSYVAMHLVNHILGLWSLRVMELALEVIARFWSQYPMLVLLYGSFTIHWGLGLWALWQRRTLRLRGSEWAQIVLGFAIPILLAQHVTANRIGPSLLGTTPSSYTPLLWTLFVQRPERGIMQLIALIVAWSHAMIGLHFWLRVRPRYERIKPLALTVAVLVPVLATLGVLEASRVLADLADQPGWTGRTIGRFPAPDPETAAALERISDGLSWFFGATVGAVLAARYLRRLWQRRRGVLRVSYPDGRFVDVLPGTSVLEASRLAGIPHASVCGGRGRCSTCRIRVRAAFASLDLPAEAERQVLARIRARANIRLACQLRPRGPVEVTPLLPPLAQAREGLSRVDIAQGVERDVAILFADIRGFTALAEGRLPYDVVFVLNRYFAAMGRAIETAGGRVDKFIGDGIMALFGMEGPIENGCRDALAAARLMSHRLVELNDALQAELVVPLRIGIGIHVGPVIVGELGYGGATTITAIGDAVNTASRLERLTKEFQCELVVSETVVRRAGFDSAAFDWHRVEIRGRQEVLAVGVCLDAGELPEPGNPPADISAAALAVSPSTRSP